MNESLQEIATLAAAATTQPTATPIPGLSLIKGKVSADQLAAVYEPMIGFIIQGGKTISIGSQVLHLTAPSYFVISTEVPATGRVHQGAGGLPYLSSGLRLNHNALAALLNDLPADFRAVGNAGRFSGCDATADFVDAWLRMMRLLKRPGDIQALAPAYEREILYSVLLGPQGWRLRELCFANGNASRIGKIVQSIRQNYSKALDIRSAAEKCAMSVRTFYREFKEITSLTPVQYQKQLRLLEARQLLVFGGHSVSDAAYEVGYESASQFNREYTRHFGASPARDASRMRTQVPPLPVREAASGRPSGHMLSS
jgi:AraC-like DNA-binding protein